MASGTPSAKVRIPVTDLFFSTPTSARTILLLEKYPVAEKICDGRKILRQRNIYPGRAHPDQKFDKKTSECRKVSHSAESTLFHCGTIPYPLPKTEHYRLYLTEAIPYLNALPSYLNKLKNLRPILKHCRIHTLS